jgi:hypothetical protein
MGLSLLENLVVVVVCRQGCGDAAAALREHRSRFRGRGRGERGALEEAGSLLVGDARFGEREREVVVVHGGQPRGGR